LKASQGLLEKKRIQAATHAGNWKQKVVSSSSGLLPPTWIWTFVVVKEEVAQTFLLVNSCSAVDDPGNMPELTVTRPSQVSNIIKLPVLIVYFSLHNCVTKVCIMALIACN
jgi:hypothetical protein